MVTQIYEWCWTIAACAVVAIGTAVLVLIATWLWWIVADKLLQVFKVKRAFVEFLVDRMKRPDGKRMSDEEASELKEATKR